MQRRPRDQAEAVVLGGRDDLQLDGALQQVVDRLLAGETEEVAGLRALLRLGDVPAGEVAGADVDDLALGDQHLHRLPDLLPGSRPVDVVHLVEVDVVGLQPPQAGIDGAPDVERGELALVGPLPHVAVQLGGEDGPLAAAAALREPAADDLFGAALVLGPAVDVGGVEEVDALLVGGVHDLVGVGLFGVRAEVHGAQAQAGDGQAGTAEVGELHGPPPSAAPARLSSTILPRAPEPRFPCGRGQRPCVPNFRTASGRKTASRRALRSRLAVTGWYSGQAVAGPDGLPNRSRQQPVGDAPSDVAGGPDHGRHDAVDGHHREQPGHQELAVPASARHLHRAAEHIAEHHHHHHRHGERGDQQARRLAVGEQHPEHRHPVARPC